MHQFSSIAALTQYMAGAILPAIEVAEVEGLRAAADLVCEHAKDMIGREDNGWPELAESTVSDKLAQGYGGKVSATDPLLRTGELRASIHVDIDGHVAQIGSADPIAAYQEFGTSKIPPRSFLAASLIAKQEQCAELILKKVVEAFEGL